MSDRKVEFPLKFQQFFKPRRKKVAKGGRGSGKSWNIARALLLLGTQGVERVLCGREYQKSMADSVHQLLSDQIADLNLEKFYEIQEKGIFGRNGTQFKFAGVKTNPTTIKSFEGITKFWMEEAEKVSKKSWGIVIPTVRRPGSEIWVSYNPDEEADPTHQMFSVNPDPDTLVVEMNWMDNPWFPEVLRKEKDHAYRVDPEAADNIWGGNVRKRTKAAIMRDKCVQYAFTPVTDGFAPWFGPYDGGDWGFSTDPCVAIRVWVSHDRKRLYVERESWQLGMDNDDIAPQWRKDVPQIGELMPVLCDNSRPEQVSHVSKARVLSNTKLHPELQDKRVGGVRCRSADKWPGSVEDGITWMRNFEEIVIHPRCVHTWEEAREYSYKVDKLTGVVTSEIVDAWNHCWDAIRYACQKMIRNKRSLMDNL